MQLLICGPDGDPAFSAETAVLACLRGQTIAQVFQARLCARDGQPAAPDEPSVWLNFGHRLIPLDDPGTRWLAEWWLFLHAVYFLEQPELFATAQECDGFRDGQRGMLYRAHSPYPAPNRPLCSAAAIAALVGGRAIIQTFQPQYEAVQRRSTAQAGLHPLFTLGYTGWRPEQLADVVTQQGALLVDIRYAPWSRVPHWQSPAVRDLVGPTNYLHLKALGNRNYNNDGPMLLHDPHGALPIMRRLLAERPAILLCACADVAHCHRLFAATVIADGLGVAVTHLRPAVPVRGRNLPLPLDL